LDTRRAFRLFKFLGIEKPPVHTSDEDYKPKPGQLRRYYMDGGAPVPQYFNDVRAFGNPWADKKEDPFQLNAYGNKVIPPE
jgi:hypothetical protein